MHTPDIQRALCKGQRIHQKFSSSNILRRSKIHIQVLNHALFGQRNGHPFPVSDIFHLIKGMFLQTKSQQKGRIYLHRTTENPPTISQISKSFYFSNKLIYQLVLWDLANNFSLFKEQPYAITTGNPDVRFTGFPGPLTTQPITATLIGFLQCAKRRSTSSAIAIRSILVRPQVGQETN